MHCKYMKTHFPLCYHNASMSAQCVCAFSLRVWFAFVLCFSCWGKQLDRRIKRRWERVRERESFTTVSSSDLSQAHALITDTACQLDTLLHLLSRLYTRSNCSHRRNEKAYMDISHVRALNVCTGIFPKEMFFTAQMFLSPSSLNEVLFIFP